MLIFHSYVKLPEGTASFEWNGMGSSEIYRGREFDRQWSQQKIYNMVYNIL